MRMLQNHLKKHTKKKKQNMLRTDDPLFMYKKSCHCCNRSHYVSDSYFQWDKGVKTYNLTIITRGIFEKHVYVLTKDLSLVYNQSNHKGDDSDVLSQYRSLSACTNKAGKWAKASRPKKPVSLKGGWLQFWYLCTRAPFPEWSNILNWTITSGLENEGGHRCRPSP